MYIPTPQIPNNAPPVMAPAAAAAQQQQLQSQVSSGNEAMARLNAAAAVAVAKNQLQHMQVRKIKSEVRKADSKILYDEL